MCTSGRKAAVEGQNEPRKSFIFAKWSRAIRSTCTIQWIGITGYLLALIAAGCDGNALPESGVGASSSLATPLGVTFEDVTSRAGVSYDNPALDPDHPDYCLPMVRFVAGVVAADFDADGWTDLFVTRLEKTNLLFRNRGDGTFEEVGLRAGVDLVAQSSGCAVADVNNDGTLDLYVLTLGERNYLYLNDGGGRFTEAAQSYELDMHSDDLPRERSTAAFGDYDNDGDLDAVVTEWRRGGMNRVLRNDEGRFVDVTDAIGIDLSDFVGFAAGFSDIDGDGWPDLLVVGDFNTSRMFRNLGGDRFEDITSIAGVGTDEFGMGSAIGDINNDGALDWFVTSTYGNLPRPWGGTGNRLYVNGGDGVFFDGTDQFGVRDGSWGWGASFFDFDNDGYLDLAMTNGILYPCFDVGWSYKRDQLRLWRNSGGESMVELAAELGFSDRGTGKGLLHLDYDNDGDLDVFITNNDGPPTLLRNNRGNMNNWLRVALRGHTSNRFGIGARIRLLDASGALQQIREVSANSNYMSQNEITAHFGLRDQTIVASIEIHWPTSDCVQVVRHLAVNSLAVIDEPVECNNAAARP